MAIDTIAGDDERWMQRALALAARADHRTGHNPKVGAIIVRDGHVLGQGHHMVSGAAHAEVLALAAARAAGHDVRGATLHVTLEPCRAFPEKRTPACVGLLLEHGLGRVVIAMEDPNPHVAGASIALLRARGVHVDVGVCAQQAWLLNAPYVKWAVHEQPFVTACWSAGGERTQRMIRQMRGAVDAVLVGVDAVHRDDPMLTRGDVPGLDPVRVVIDGEGRLPVTSRLARTARSVPVLVLTSALAPAGWQQAMAGLGVEVACVGHPSPAACLAELARRNLRRVLLEDDGAARAAFLRGRMVDRVVCHVPAAALAATSADAPAAAQVLVQGLAADLPDLAHVQVTHAGDVAEVSAYLRAPAARAY